MTHPMLEIEPYNEALLDTNMALVGLVSTQSNPYPSGSLEASEYARGVRDAQRRAELKQMAYGGLALAEA